MKEQTSGLLSILKCTIGENLNLKRELSCFGKEGAIGGHGTRRLILIMRAKETSLLLQLVSNMLLLLENIRSEWLNASRNYCALLMKSKLLFTPGAFCPTTIIYY